MRKMAYFKRCKRVRTPHLPIDIIFYILLHIPADILHNVMRYVCKEWYTLIRDQSFISSHLLQAPIGLSVHAFFADFVYFVETRGSGIKINKENFKLKARTFASCNGLYLLGSRTEDGYGYVHYVANPVTNKLLTLPQTTHHYNCSHFSGTGFGYAASTGAYKMVNLWQHKTVEEGSCKKIYWCEILTLGVDKSWRCTSNYYTTILMEFKPPISIKGVLYWASIFNPTILAFDVETELFHVFDIPKGLKRKLIGRFLAMGDYLAVVGKRQGLRLKVWVAREVRRIGEEWTRLPDINLELLPVGWLKEGELFLLRRPAQHFLLFVYNVKTREVSSFKIDVPILNPLIQIFPHMRSFGFYISYLLPYASLSVSLSKYVVAAASNLFRCSALLWSMVEDHCIGWKI